MTSYTPTERAYAALHEDYVSGLLSRAEYEAECRRLSGQSPAQRGAWRRWALAAIVIIIPLLLALIYVAGVH